ncbi:branched-chain amino acid ABC transporter permease [Verminephrobacter eiseniae]|uniref:branched-chain amino acid ABC transporter permease n=1 Tax=Verminephrobacter eiseniae TaxID=364317 RepID=UPI0010ED55E2|nr:branched-chain amino acid ABC transporter permease [Verminephrobacter eiseniae]KAB7559706.1 branched-chain amino acid ABC transporter permease [Verminephrobacter sp. Larva24]MCW5230392.1 branched-chain amino acid ABC transporter permease [Verminephrobacter eiseniae]MCW5292126.1 branched-chain amino acid ABC transporter permease [Verminephrobacter eiseniae]MCW8184800.1 branched-chain amino acid ABC transporter permease [Verminephrobacter eiseniae]MCW8222538.1 branched-chain amino acid ABC tr
MLQFFIDTLLRTTDLALIALGLSMLYGLVKFPNVAHVQYAMCGAFLAYAGHSAGAPLAAALALASALTGLITLALQRLVFKRLLQGGPAIAMIGSLAIAMLLVAGVQGIAGSFPRMFSLPSMDPVVIGAARITPVQLGFCATTMALLLLFVGLLFRTRAGRAMRALASNPMLAQACGLDAQRITYAVTFISGAVAGLGGAMLALSTGAHINLGYDLLLPVFAAAILGGLGNPVGAVAGALLIALTETIVTHLDFGPLVGQELRFLPVAYIGAASFLILLLTLLFKPHGLFGAEVRRV